MISQRTYNILKQYSFDSLTADQQTKVLEYEIYLSNEQAKRKEVLDKQKAKEPTKRQIEVLTHKKVKEYFEYFYNKIYQKTFVYNDQNKLQMDMIFYYFAQDKKFESFSSEYSLNKGLALMGDCGLGKTSIMKAFEELGKVYYQKKNDLRFYFLLKSASKIATDYQNDETKRDLAFYQRGTICFDDLGQEQLVFGDKNLMKSIIEQRYIERFELRKPNSKTHLTTNYSLDELGLKYGEHIKDRLKESCNFIIFTGESFRK